jgi:hypothetical protein
VLTQIAEWYYCVISKELVMERLQLLQLACYLEIVPTTELHARRLQALSLHTHLQISLPLNYGEQNAPTIYFIANTY